MANSKIHYRALIMQEIAKLRALSAVSDKDIEACISNLSSIEDKEFLCTTLLKEIDGSLVYFDGVLAILAIQLAGGVLEKCVFTFLDKPQVSEKKKLFLINLLHQVGAGLDPNLIHLYIKNPDEIIDLETEKFLRMAEVNPEAQIDFLDFYYGIGEKDRNILLESIIDDYSGDLLANILTPIIYSVKDDNVLKMCIRGLFNSKSYLAYEPLEWLIKSSSDSSLISLAKKTKNELKIAGLRENVTNLEYYTELFRDSKPLHFFVSPVDGASNFSLIFSREYNNGTVSAFFAVFNLEKEPVSCFGFSNISKKEYEVILSRFFKQTDKIPLDVSFGKTLIDYFIDKALFEKKEIPYELLCWRQLTYDIESLKTPIEEYMAHMLKKNDNVTDFDLKRAINSEYASKWFFPYSSTYPEFMELIDNICALKDGEYEKFDVLTSTVVQNSKNSNLFCHIKNRFLYQAYFLRCLEFENLSKLFFSIYSSGGALNKFYDFSIKKSVYEFFLGLKSVQESSENNIFAKQRKVKFFDFNAQLMLELIEKRWIN